jgi:hypothetical protein
LFFKLALTYSFFIAFSPFPAYNSNVPTPFYHLSLAEDLLRRSDLPAGSLKLLLEHRPAFLLGNTAPDVQTVSGQARQATHFFEVPILPGSQPAWERLLALHPSLAGHWQSPEQAAFLSGYLCHLQADWLWVEEIFSPVFGPRAAWQTFRRRLYLHNVLRAYLDRQILEQLRPETGSELGRVLPMRWLPFVEDVNLCDWRDFLAQQLHPGSKVQTVEVFAARQGFAPQEYYALLSSEERLDQEIFNHLPRQELLGYRQRLLEANTRLIAAYLDGGQGG